MDLNQRVKALEDEIKVLKTEVKVVLLDIREQYLNQQNPFSGKSPNLNGGNQGEAQGAIAQGGQPTVVIHELVKEREREPSPATQQSVQKAEPAPAEPVSTAPELDKKEDEEQSEWLPPAAPVW
jgi:hypothetical protein